MAQYKGVVERGGKEYIKMQDLLLSMSSPNVADVKLGVRTYLEDEVQNKKRRMDLLEKAKGLKVNHPHVELTPEVCGAGRAPNVAGRFFGRGQNCRWPEDLHVPDLGQGLGLTYTAPAPNRPEQMVWLVHYAWAPDREGCIAVGRHAGLVSTAARASVIGPSGSR